MPKQSLAHLLLPEGEFRIIRCDIADKLLKCADGDSALLYLYILRHGAAAEESAAMRALGFSKEQYERALFTLTSLTISAQPEEPQKESAPSYTASELRTARGGDHRFSAVCEEAEGLLGKTLTESQLRTLFTIYDHLGLPAEVIMELLGCLKRELGAVRLGDIRKEAYRWADMGLYTAEAAQDYLSRREAERPLTEAMFAALGTEPRAPKAMEKRLISYAVAHGFPPEAMELAVRRTERTLKKFSADYVRKILESWESKGVHTLAEITALEPENDKKNAAVPEPDPATLSEWEKDWLEEVKRYQEEKNT